MAPKIYWLSGSAPCWKAMISLEECGVTYEEQLLQMSKGEHKTPEMLALNPRGQLPVYVDGNSVICESLAICMFVNGQYGQGKLLTGNKALVLQRFMEVANLNTASYGMYFLMRVKPGEEADPKLKEENGGKLAAELDRWDKHLEGKDYLAGDTFSLADCSMFPHLAFLVRMGLQLADRFPNLQKFYTRVSERPSVKKTWPPEWTGDNKTLLSFVK